MEIAHTLATALIKSQKTWARKPADFYPTPYDVTQALLDFLQIDEFATVWEPACGDGDMALVVEANGHRCLSSDLRATNYCMFTGGHVLDFLKPYPEFDSQTDWIISNPPFSFAAEFVERALQITPNVAMLVRSQYWHARGRHNMFQRNKPAFMLPLTWRPAFEEKTRGKSPLMDVSWCVWRGRGRNEDPAFVPLLRPTATRMSPIIRQIEKCRKQIATEMFEDLL